MHGWKGSFICLDRSCFNASSTLAIPCAFMSLVCVCVRACMCVCVCISVLGLCPAKYMYLYVYELSCDYASGCNWKRVCVCVCVFFITQLSVIQFQRTNSGIQFDRCETSQRNVFIAVQKRIYCCCKHTIIHVNVLSYNQPIVSLYLRYSQRSFGATSFEMHLPQTGYQCSCRELTLCIFTC